MVSKVFPLKPYSVKYPLLFKKERSRLLENSAIKGLVVEIEHIGSTAVPGLGGKEVIDILLTVKNADDVHLVVAELVNLGLVFKESAGSFGRKFLSDRPLDEGDEAFHYHVVVENSPEYINPIRFRDVLRANIHAQEEYFALKQTLSKTAQTPNEYRDGKSEFIKRALGDENPRDRQAK